MIARVAVHVLVPLVAAEHGPPAQRLLPVLLHGAEALGGNSIVFEKSPKNRPKSPEVNLKRLSTERGVLSVASFEDNVLGIFSW